MSSLAIAPISLHIDPCPGDFSISKMIRYLKIDTVVYTCSRVNALAEISTYTSTTSKLVFCSINMSKIVFCSMYATVSDHQREVLSAVHQALWIYGGTIMDSNDQPTKVQLTVPWSMFDSATLECMTTDEREPVSLQMDPVTGVYYRGDHRNIAIPAGPIHWWDEKRMAILRMVLRDNLPRCILDAIFIPLLIWPKPSSLRSMIQTRWCDE